MGPATRSIASPDTFFARLADAGFHVVPGVKAYTPDGSAFKYLIVYTEGIIFTLADGMHGPTLRLPPDLAAEQIASGAVPRPEYGPGWVMLSLFQGIQFPLIALVHIAYELVAYPQNRSGG